MEIRSACHALMLSSMLFGSAAVAAPPVVDVYKSASCGCCGQWVDHLKRNGFSVNTHDVPDPSDYREKYGIPDQLGSCHTATVSGYAIEGHVPASDIRRLLAERPKANGLSVPGMPMGSPGMEGPRNDPYDVLLIQAGGNHKVYQRYTGNQAGQVSAPTDGAESVRP